jgi:hypothetical protein
MEANTVRKLIGAMLVGTMVLSAGVTPALGGSTNQSSASGEQGPSDLTIDGVDLAIEDVDLHSEGLPPVDIEDRTYTIDERSVTIEAGNLSVGDTDIGFDAFTVTIEDSSITMDNVSIGGE